MNMQGYRIAVDARPLVYTGNGNARYLEKMLSELISLRPEDHWILLSHEALNPEYASLVSRQAVEVRVDLGMPGPLWLQKTPRRLSECDADLFWATLAMLPYGYTKKTNIPAILNYHDLNAFIAPDTMKTWNRFQHKLMAKNNIKQARRILCLSETTKSHILRFFPDTDPGKLDIVYPGMEIDVDKASPPPELATIPGPENQKDYILCVGTIEPRKNQRMLIDGYLAARKKQPDLRPLILAGRKGWGADELYQELKSGRLSDQGIHFIEGPSSAGLNYLYRNAGLVAFPSLHEGFGIPVLEALDQKKPVLLSDIEIFREICPQAMFAKLQSEDWEKAIQEADRKLKEKSLAAPTLDRNAWSWKTRAQTLSSVMDEVLTSRPE